MKTKNIIDDATSYQQHDEYIRELQEMLNDLFAREEENE